MLEPIPAPHPLVLRFYRIPAVSAWLNIQREYRMRKKREPGHNARRFVAQMLCSAYLSRLWLGRAAAFRPWSPTYWLWLAQWSSLSEIGTRARLADGQINGRHTREYEERQEAQAEADFHERKARFVLSTREEQIN